MRLDLNQLNSEQRRAVTTINGPLLVLAGAGTGKTTVITWRIAYMLEQGIAPENILAVTFTNKAAREMKERLRTMLPNIDPRAMTVSTFHSFGARVLRQHANKVGLLQNFGIADEGDTRDLVREIVMNRHLDKGKLDPREYRSRISQAKSDLLTPDQLSQDKLAESQIVAPVYRDYEQRLLALNLVDFDDLLMKTVQLLQNRDDLRNGYRERYTHLLVDEFQDTNGAQARMLQLLTGAPPNLCVVGDDDQSIYAWRGADISNILDFPSCYADTQVIRLEENYRSSPGILAAANAAIARNEKRHGKVLWSRQQAGDPPTITECINGEEEAKTIAKLLKAYHTDQKINYCDMAILYRSNHLSRNFETCLRSSRIPYRVVGSSEFYERREIKDAAAYLRIVANPANELSLRRILNVPPRGIGDVTVLKISEHAQANGQSMLQALRDKDCLATLPAAAAVGIRDFNSAYEEAFRCFSSPGNISGKAVEYLRKIGYLDGLQRIYRNHEEALDRLANVHEFLVSATDFDRDQQLGSLVEFLEASALLDEQDRAVASNEEESGVNLMTIHAAKGLEFALVVVVAVEEGVFPHERAMSGPEGLGLAEERRLFYVAMTRAKRYLFMTFARSRKRFGSTAEARPSRFLHELPQNLVQEVCPANLCRPASKEEAMAHLAKLYELLKANPNSDPTT